MFGEILFCWILGFHDWKRYTHRMKNRMIAFLFVCPRCNKHHIFNRGLIPALQLKRELYMLKIGSLFSGIGGFECAFSEIGEIVWCAEIDKYASALHKYQIRSGINASEMP